MQPAIELTPLATNTTVNGYTPQQIDKAYGFDSISLTNSSGGTVKGDGSGQTIAIVDAYNDPNIASDLKAFDKQFSLSDPNFKVVSQTGSTTSLPKTDAGWGAGNLSGRRVGAFGCAEGKHHAGRGQIGQPDRPAQRRRLRTQRHGRFGCVDELGNQ